MKKTFVGWTHKGWKIIPGDFATGYHCFAPNHKKPDDGEIDKPDIYATSLKEAAERINERIVDPSRLW